MIDRDEIVAILKTVTYPKSNQDILTLGTAREIRVEQGRIAVNLELPGKDPGIKWIVEGRCKKALKERAPKAEIEVHVDIHTAEKDSPQPASPIRRDLIPSVKFPIAVASGKGGVGKSTVAVNLAFSLAAAGKSVGLFDADIHGPNIPRMLGIEGKVPEATEQRKIVPIERNGVRAMSIGLIARPDQAIIWRGPLIGKAIEKMLIDVVWGDLDYLIINLPPGTGDAQLTLSQRVSIAGAVMVTTPQSVALSDVRRGILMFRNVDVPILGLVENMAYYACPTCGSREEIFPGRELEEMARELSVDLLGRIPIDPRISSGGDSGDPIVLTDPDGEVGSAFKGIAKVVIDLTENP